MEDIVKRILGNIEKGVEEAKKSMLEDAEIDLARCNAIIELCKSNTLACEILIDGHIIGLCNNEKVIPALEHHKKEIQKYIDGKENEWI
jgi:uncharacterized protein YuzB (UPF0349 family)